MKYLLPVLLIPSAVLAHSGHDIAPTPQGLHHAMGHADHLGAILGAASGALVLLSVALVVRHRRKMRA